MLTFITFQSNRLSKIENLDMLVNLKELYLSQNFIDKIENLDKLVNLVILDFAYNRIESIENLENNKMLEDLWLNNNNIRNFKDLNHLKCLPVLNCIYLWRNGVADFPSYKQTLKEICPTLKQIDTTYL